MKTALLLLKWGLAFFFLAVARGMDSSLSVDGYPINSPERLFVGLLFGVSIGLVYMAARHPIEGKWICSIRGHAGLSPFGSTWICKKCGSVVNVNPFK